MSNRVKILVIDDDEAVRLSYYRILRDSCDDVRLAGDGPSGLHLMESVSFDLVLLDLRMPGMSGLEVLREIKARWPHTAVLVITGYASLESVKEAVKFGAHDYLMKPVGPAQVVEAAASALVQKRWEMVRATA